MPMAGPVIMKGPVQGWMDEQTASAEGRAQFRAHLNNPDMTLRELIDQSLGYVWNPNDNINVTIVTGELEMVQQFWFPGAEQEANLRKALAAALDPDKPVDFWWECTSLAPETREVYVRDLPQKVSTLFYSDLPYGPPAVSVFRHAQGDAVNEIGGTKRGGDRYLI